MLTVQLTTMSDTLVAMRRSKLWGFENNAAIVGFNFKLARGPKLRTLGMRSWQGSGLGAMTNPRLEISSLLPLMFVEILDYHWLG